MSAFDITPSELERKAFFFLIDLLLYTSVQRLYSREIHCGGTREVDGTFMSKHEAEKYWKQMKKKEVTACAFNAKKNYITDWHEQSRSPVASIGLKIKCPPTIITHTIVQHINSVVWWRRGLTCWCRKTQERLTGRGTKYLLWRTHTLCNRHIILKLHSSMFLISILSVLASFSSLFCFVFWFFHPYLFISSHSRQQHSYKPTVQ